MYPVAELGLHRHSNFITCQGRATALTNPQSQFNLAEREMSTRNRWQ
jgi:hypothetical protein